MTVLVVGGGIAGMVAARSLSLRGYRVTLVEAGDRLGGSVRGADLGGMTIDIGAESVATKGTGALELIGQLGLTAAAPRRGGAWLQIGDRAVPLPAAGVLGIPSSPLADDVRSAIGWRASIRAYADRVMPELKIGRRETLGSLVSRRMGETVLDTLVRPVVEGVYGVDPDQADADALAPGITGALARAGSLSGAVAMLRGDAPAGAAVLGIEGGVHLMVSALEADLLARGVEVVRETRSTALLRDGSGWRVEHERGIIDAEQVVVATGGAAARDLIAPLVGHELVEGWPQGRTTTVVALLLDDERLGDATRGTGVLVATPSAGSASALTHSTAKWPWLAATLPAGRHIVRLTYRGEWRDLREETLVADAYRLLGVESRSGTLVARADAVWTQDAPSAQLHVDRRLRAVTDAVADVPGISVTGAWIGGTGLARVIDHASQLSLI